MNSTQKILLQELDSLGNWHHRVNLGDGKFTTDNQSAPNPQEKWKLLEPYVPEDLSGKTVLDLGCNSGYFSVQMKLRGASHVVSVDNEDLALKQANFLARWFDVELEFVKQEAHVYCLTTDQQFDYVLFLGLFYHLKYPVLVLDRLAEMTKSRLYFQSAVVGPKISEYTPKENYSNEERDELNKMEDFPKLLFIETKFDDSPGNWWLPNDSAIIGLLRNAQLNIIARPARAVYVCEPKQTFGKNVFQKLVFPGYGKSEFKDLFGQKF